MSLGRVVVATDWSGTTDFLDASCGVPVAYKLVAANDPRGVFMAPGAFWAEADVAHAAAALRELAASPDRRRALGAAARQAVMAKLDAAPLRAALSGIGLKFEAERSG
jgi:glycosyltransferase involved in cell wall biosynthesis